MNYPDTIISDLKEQLVKLETALKAIEVLTSPTMVSHIHDDEFKNAMMLIHKISRWEDETTPDDEIPF